MRGLIVNVYTDERYRPARKHSRSGAVVHAFGDAREVTIVETVRDGLARPLPEGSQVFAPTPDRPAARLVYRMVAGEVIVHAEPVEKPEGLTGRPMCGGAFVACSDSRFRELIGFYGAVSLHDRFEW